MALQWSAHGSKTTKYSFHRYLIGVSVLDRVLYLWNNNCPWFLFLDEGGIYKSKLRNPNAEDATEVSETDQTRVDMPVDNMEAKQVRLAMKF